MADQVFVAREQELGQLWQFLERTLGSRGQVCFVTGEAGSGKTALVTEFARRVQERQGNLIVAVGQCDAHTGIGDPYLPFREVVCQLMGDVEAKLARGAITEENANRLRKLVSVSAQILVEVAPDLVGLFVPGANIVGELGKAVAKQVGWMERLEEMTRQPKPGSPGLEESQVFEQYTNLLKALAEKQPLLLILDDLHWADAGSLGLLFRLGRRIGGSRILIVGTYRPEEVALERLGRRHPMQKVLAEFKRYFGEMGVDLDRAGETEGKRFVHAILALEPNRLSEEFGHVLFQRTRGHPLFTIELLRDMQERGALVQDGRGRWLEGPLLDWDELPDRVEGIIEERIGRLEGALRDILSVASVEGQDFTAQVIARVKEIREWELLRVLSQELERRHRLVREREEVKLGRQFLARYQFAHALFQQYLYSQLGAGERRVLHGQIASQLEELYQGHTERIAVQLARHYSEAGEDDRAVDFLVRAGDAAARLYAHVEARLHYARALDALARLPDNVENRRRRVDLLTKRVASSWIADSTEGNLGRLAEAERLVRGLAGSHEMPSGDRVRLAHVHFWMGRVHFRGIRMPDVIRHYSQGLTVAREIGDPELIARLSAGIGHALAVQGREAQAESLLRRAMTVQKQVGDRSEWLQTLAYHGLTTVLTGGYALGMAELQRALAGAQEIGHVTLTFTIQLLLALAHGCSGEPLQAVEDTRKMAEAAEESGDQLLVYVSLGWGAWAEALAGLFEAAEASRDRAQVVAEEIGGRLVFEDWFRSAGAEIALGAGRIEEALDLAGQAVGMAQEVDNLAAEAYARLAWGQALAELEPPRWNEAEAQFAEGLRLFESGQGRLWAARTHVAWGAVSRDRGDVATAHKHWAEAAALWEASGITWELDKVRALIAALPDE